MRKEQLLAAADFKARCLAVLDQVAATGRAVVITKRGKPVARVSPLAPQVRRTLRGSLLAQHDLVSPLDQDWQVGE